MQPQMAYYYVNASGTNEAFICDIKMELWNEGETLEHTWQIQTRKNTNSTSVYKVKKKLNIQIIEMLNR